MIYWHKALCLDAALLEKYRVQINRLIAGEYKGTHLDLKKLQNYRLYTIRINDADRLLFTTIQKNGINYLVLLEEILEHDYQKSRFLKPHVLKNFLDNNAAKLDAIINENNFTEIPELPVKLGSDPEFKAVEFYNDKFIVLNEAQNQAVKSALPMVVSGPAGSGKTTVAMRVLAQCAQQYADAEFPILYVTESVTLRNNLKAIWDASPDKNDKVTFRTYAELFGTVNLAGKDKFYEWFGNRKNEKKLFEAEVIYQEFRLLSACETEAEYLALGAKQTQFLDIEKRKTIWQIYHKYLKFLTDNNLIDPALAPLPLKDSYAAIVVDEAQDLSMLQLKQLSLAAQKRRICYCMDSHQSLQDNRSKRPFLLQNLHRFTEHEPNHIILPYSYRCPDNVNQATTPLMAMKRRLTGRADKYEVTEILSAPGAALGNVHWVEPGKLTSYQVRGFEELKNSHEFAVVTLPEYFDEACKRFRSLVFTPEQIKGLEYRIIVAYRMFDAPIYAQANAALSREISDEQFRMPFNQVITAFTRAQETLIIYQEKRHEIKTITSALPHTEWQATETIKPSTFKDWKKEQARQKEANNTTQAEMIAEKFGFSLDKFVAHHQKHFPKAMRELLENPDMLVILAEERTLNNKSFFEVIDNKKWAIFIEIIEEYIKTNGIEKFLRVALSQAESIFETFDQSEKAVQFINLLRKAVFFAAMGLPDYDVIEKCLIAGFNPNTEDGEGHLPICTATEKDDADLISLLVEHGAHIDLCESDGFTALSLAASVGAVALGEFLLDMGAKVNSLADNKPALMYAIVNKHKNFVEMLLQRGADADLSGDDRTPLFLAAATDIEILRILVNHNKRDLNKTSNPDIGNQTPLHAAVEKKDLEAVRILVDAGANMYAEDSLNAIPPAGAATLNLPEMLKLFLDKGFDLNYKNKTGGTLLNSAHSDRSYECAKLLLERGANVNDPDNNHLLTAVMCENLKFVELFLAHGADPHRKTKLAVSEIRKIKNEAYHDFIKAREIVDRHILVSAAEIATLMQKQNPFITQRVMNPTQATVPAPTLTPGATYIDQLLAKDNASFSINILKIIQHANVVKILTEKKTHDGKNIFEAISDEKWGIFLQIVEEEIIRVSKDQTKHFPLDSLIDLPDENCNLGPSPKAREFIEAVVARVFSLTLFAGNIEGVKKCLKKKTSVTNFDGRSFTPLGVAAKHQSLELMQLLLDHKYRPQAEDKDGITPLHACCINGFVEGAILLLNHGAEMDRRANSGSTPLHIAISSKQTTMLVTLLQRGADVNLNNLSGDTPLILATKNNSIEYVRILLMTKKCDVNMANFEGLTPLHIATKNGNLDMVNALLEAGAKQVQTISGSTPLQYAVFTGLRSILMRLIDAGGDVNMADKNGYSPLVFAVDRGDELLVKYLLSKNANTSQANILGETPLAITIARENTKLAEVLLQHGCIYHMPLTLSLKNVKSLANFAARESQLTQFMTQNAVASEAETISMTPSQLAGVMGRTEIFRMIKTKELAALRSPVMAQIPAVNVEEYRGIKPT